MAITKRTFYSVLTNPNIFYYFCLILFCALVVLNSWIEEDAFITFRVVDNFMNGYGLRWNINERVQSYTNPLWMLLHISAHPLTGSVVQSTFLLSWLCLAGTLLVVRYTFEFSLLRHAALFLVPLLVSPTLTLFFTSGLETPLLSFLFVCFGFVLIRLPSHYWLWLSILTSASICCRLDAVILYTPIWMHLLYEYRRSLNLRDIIVGTIPIQAWMLFSLFYYGFFLPNTALAKLNTGLPLLDYLRSGIAYTVDFLVADPWSGVLISAAAIYFPLCAWKSYRQGVSQANSNTAAAISIGITLYCCYIIYIGGYQLSLRMNSLPCIATCWLWLWRFPISSNSKYICYAMAALGIYHFALTSEERRKIPLIAKQHISGRPMAQYLFNKTGTSWFDYIVNTGTITHQPDHTPKKLKVLVRRGIGQHGYYNGPFEIIIDPLALSEPLLSRLPSNNPHLLRVGHIARDIPNGYLEAVEKGTTQNMSAPLSHYYKKLQLITQGELCNPERLMTIIRFNLGEYDHLLNQYLRETYPKTKH